MNFTKAEKVEQAYYEACGSISSEGCYSNAVAMAHKLGGIEIYNSNDDSNTKSFAPSITFEFDDSSIAYVSYGGVDVIQLTALTDTRGTC